MDKKHRRRKKNIKRNLKAIAKKIPLAFKNKQDKKDWIKSCVKGHPGMMR